MRVIFLDIDGVLNSASWGGVKASGVKARGPVFGGSEDLVNAIDPLAVACLNRIIKGTGALVVLSSSWRSFVPISPLNRVLVSKGMCKPLFGVTPPDGYPRGAQIQAWLDIAGDAVESFIILDDDSDMLHLSHRLIQTSWEKGLRTEHVGPAIKLLGAL